MENYMERGVSRGITCLWLAGSEGMEKSMETTVMGNLGITIRIHSFISLGVKVRVQT